MPKRINGICSSLEKCLTIEVTLYKEEKINNHTTWRYSQLQLKVTVTCGVKAHKLLMKALLRMKWFLIVIYRNTFISITADLRNRVHHCSSSFGDSYKTWSGFPKVHYNWAWRTLGDKSFVCQSGSKWVLIRAAIHKKFVSRLGSQWALIRVPDCKNFTGQLGCQCALMRPYDRNKFISQLGCQWALLRAPKSQ